MTTALIQSSLLGHTPHGFTTRAGGVSTGPFSSFNFGNPGDLPAAERDPMASIRENWHRAMGALGVEDRELVEVHQVHSAAVHIVRRGEPAHASASDTRADAIVTDDPTRIVAVRIADCAPVLVASTDGRVVAAIHAGWRGVIAGILPGSIAAVRQLRPASADGGLTAVIGPCIGADAFEVGPEVAAEFHRVFGTDTPFVRAGAGDRSHIDLKAVIAEQLAGLGVDRVEALPGCTYAEPERFFSHRRATKERAATGRMAAMIGAAP